MLTTARPPGPWRGFPRIRLALAWRRDPLACLLALARDNGDIVRFRLGGRQVTLLNHPSFVAQVVALDSSPDAVLYRPAGRRLFPADPLAEVVAEAAAGQCGRWHEGAPLDLYAEMHALAAGFWEAGAADVIASALIAVWGVLAEHAELERRVHGEAVGLVAGQPPPEMPETGRVVAEALRLYPPVWAAWRRVLAPVSIGGYGIPAGTWLLLSPWVLHHDSRYYPDPCRCDPLRWTAQAAASRPRYTYLPFGEPGAEPPWTAGIAAVVAIARRWHVQPATPGRLILEPAGTLRAWAGFWTAIGRPEER